MKQTYRTKKAANEQAKFLRKEGKKVRITENKNKTRKTHTVHSSGW